MLMDESLCHARRLSARDYWRTGGLRGQPLIGRVGLLAAAKVPSRKQQGKAASMRSNGAASMKQLEKKGKESSLKVTYTPPSRSFFIRLFVSCAFLAAAAARAVSLNIDLYRSSFDYI